MGGRNANPSYEEVSAGGTGHAESVEVTYDRDKVSYQELLRVFWHNVDPLTANAQFCDHGTQYRAAIFFQNDEERRLAEESKRAIEDTKRFKEPIVTQIVAAEPFYPAEEYHQDFYKKNPIRYKFYKYNCGRAQRLEDLWGSP
jgi:peptide-methionine (S)-S-oxide reductase